MGFFYTQPTTGITMGSYSTGGVHAQTMVLTDVYGVALPADTTNGLSVEVTNIDVLAGVDFDRMTGLLEEISEQLTTLIGGLSGWMGRDFPTMPINRG